MIRLVLTFITSLGFTGCASTRTASTYTYENPPLGVLISDRGVVFEGAPAIHLFAQCSRPSPDASGGIWVPEAEIIEVLESRFPDFYQQATSIRHLSLEFYYRQYAGFIDHGRKLVYASFFPWFTPSKEMQAEDPVRWDPERWKKEPVIICDGGGRFFGVVFDPESKTFEDFEMNGF